MPWKVEPVSDIRLAFVHQVISLHCPVAQACRKFHISRKTGYKWLRRYRLCPEQKLADQSRFLLALHARTDMTMATAWQLLGNVFDEYGLPDELLCDNAFGSTCPHIPSLSWFEAQPIRLGIRPTHGRPYHPQTQGKIERL